MRILIVEDNSTEMERAVKAVTAAGHEAITASYVYWGMKKLVAGWPLDTEELT